MKMKKSKMVSTLLAVVLLMACSNDDSNNDNLDNCSWTQTVFTAFVELDEFIGDFQENPNSETCAALVAAYQEYLDAFEAAEVCVNGPEQREGYLEALAEARSEAEDIDCSDF